MSNLQSLPVTLVLLCYISESVSSVLSRDYPWLKIIISDDTSVDKTFDVALTVVNEYEGPHQLVCRKMI